MELRQLRYFVAIAEERHFGRAAHRLQVSTPTLSQQLRALERTLGVSLVDRSRPGTVTLTRGGAVLLEHARILLARADRARDEARAVQDAVEQVVVRVAPGAESLLAPQLRGLTDDTSMGAVTTTSSTSDALSALREERGDVAIVWNGRAQHYGLHSVVLQQIPIHLALPADHRLASFATVDVTELSAESIVMFPRALSAHTWDTMCHHLLPNGPVTPGQIVVEPNATGPLGVLRGVAAGKGIAPAVAPLAEHARRRGVVIRPLHPPLSIPLELAWREPTSTSLQRILRYLQATCRN